MKIKISFIATLFSFVLLFASCQKDGLYTPKEHLTRIENWEFYNGDSLFRNAEEWEWDGKLLSKITYLDRARTPSIGCALNHPHWSRRADIQDCRWR